MTKNCFNRLKNGSIQLHYFVKNVVELICPTFCLTAKIRFFFIFPCEATAKYLDIRPFSDTKIQLYLQQFENAVENTLLELPKTVWKNPLSTNNPTLLSVITRLYTEDNLVVTRLQQSLERLQT